MRTSGSYLVHEMMHTEQITQNRPHCSCVPDSHVLYKLTALVVDKEFTGGIGRRINGPKDCAKAAKVEISGTILSTQTAMPS